MDTRKALKVAIESLASEIKLLNIDANMLDKLGFRTPTTIKASRKRAELREAVEALERMRFGGTNAHKASRQQVDA